MKTVLLMVQIMVVLGIAGEKSYTPTSDYQQQNVRGWTIYLNKNVVSEYPKLTADAMVLLDFQLYQVTRVVPKRQLVEMKKVAIWIEHKPQEHSAACYHPSKQWLMKNGFNPAKEKGIEISNLTNFLKWSLQQPWMVLHELAHSYHHRVLGWDAPEVLKLYKKAVQGKKYETVLFITNGTKKAYAIKNHKEYFAETAEAYFGTNDMFPFVRSELQQIDPEMHAFHKKLWSSGHQVSRTK